MATAARVQEKAATPRVERRITVARILTYVLMIILALIFMLPLLWMLSTSLKPKAQLFEQPIRWIPQTLSYESYQKILDNPALPIGRWFLNSLGVATGVTVLSVIIDSLAAYA